MKLNLNKRESEFLRDFLSFCLNQCPDESSILWEISEEQEGDRIEDQPTSEQVNPRYNKNRKIVLSLAEKYNAAIRQEAK